MGNVISFYENRKIDKRYEYRGEDGVCLLYKANGEIGCRIVGESKDHNAYLIREVLNNENAYHHIHYLAYHREIYTLSQSPRARGHNFNEWPGMDTSKRKLVIDRPIPFILQNGLRENFKLFEHLKDILIYDVDRNVFFTNVNRGGEFKVYSENQPMLNEAGQHLSILGVRLLANVKIFDWLEQAQDREEERLLTQG
ncbi:hypothetical protein [Pseudomonas sp. NBRC 111121]|uniref:hypothetical protein n=1 Tax=Pseudomonas sp. NBRC 111121 TaxID=1661036 RepID=UPI000A486450|nr:hypothetical protein [Pseudomonas sp. NBRC 111121]